MLFICELCRQFWLFLNSADLFSKLFLIFHCLMITLIFCFFKDVLNKCNINIKYSLPLIFAQNLVMQNWFDFTSVLSLFGCVYNCDYIKHYSCFDLFNILHLVLPHCQSYFANWFESFLYCFSRPAIFKINVIKQMQFFYY